jgi:regulatory protein
MTHTALEYSIKLLAKRDYSKFKLVQKLESRDYNSEEIDLALKILIDKKYLREDVYTEDKAVSLIIRKYGNEYIHQKLLEENLTITNEELTKLRIERDLLEFDVITYLLESRLALEKNKTLQQSLSKISNYLFSRGFNESQVQDKINEKIDFSI